MNKRVNDEFNVIISSAAADVLPPVGPLPSCTLKGEHPDTEGIALMAEMPLMLCGSLSLTHVQAEIPWPVIPVVRDSSFRREELVLKGEKGFFLQRRVERGASVGPSKAQGQKSDSLTHTHITRSSYMYTLSHKDTEAHM